MNIVYRVQLIAAALAVILGSGCASQMGTTQLAGTPDDNAIGTDSGLRETTRDNATTQIPTAEEPANLAAFEAQENAEDSAIVDAGLKPAAANSDLFPPNAKPGHCYARVLTPAEFETTEEQVVKKEASFRIDVIPAEYEWVDEEVVTQEATTGLEVVPAKYKTVTEQMLVKPESKKIVEIPAEYRTEEEKILDRPAHTVWKRTAGPVDGALDIKQDQSTGEIVCLIEVPASYKTVKKIMLATPARTEEIIVPAEYESVTKTVEVEPASTREITIPAKTRMVKTRRLVKEAEEQRVEIPGTYATVVKRTKVSEELLAWQEVLCQENMSKDVIASIQQKLADQGFNSGSVDGLLGGNTLKAVNEYAKSNGLPLGKNYIAIETVNSLGVSY